MLRTTTPQFENETAQDCAAWVLASLAESWMPLAGELGIEGVPLARRLVSDPRSDHMPSRFEPFFLSDDEVAAFYAAWLV